MNNEEMFETGLGYDKETGIFKWNKKRSGVTCGGIAGSLHVSGGKTYIRISVLSKNIYAHRLAWLFEYGYMPKEIDHINGDGLDNRIVNLRAVSHKKNMRNMRRKSLPVSGFCGVYWHERAGKWEVRIGSNYIGLRESLSDAIALRKNEACLRGYSKAHGDLYV